jgi:ActR/RegA family two-component response regulator
MTAFGSIPSAVEATKLGAFYYLEKPLRRTSSSSSSPMP